MPNDLRIVNDERAASLDLRDADQLTSARRTMRAQGLTVEPAHHGKIVLLFCLLGYAALAFTGVAIDRLAVWLLLWPVMGFLFFSLTTSVHETVHLHLFATEGARRAYRTICSLILLVPMSAYTSYHLSHHVNLDSDLDPEGRHVVRNRLEYLSGMALVGPVIFIQLWTGAVRALCGRPPAYMRRAEHIRETKLGSAATLVAVVSAAIGATLIPLVWQIWLVPLALFITVWIFVLVVPEHIDDAGASVAGLPATHSSRSTTTNALVRFVGMGVNYHGVHHAWPEVPGPNLSSANQIFASSQPEQWRSSGYLAWHLRTFRRLPWMR